jgi:hypothetical protein
MSEGTASPESRSSLARLRGGIWALGFVSLFMDISSEMELQWSCEGNSCAAFWPPWSSRLTRAPADCGGGSKPISRTPRSAPAKQDFITTPNTKADLSVRN